MDWNFCPLVEGGEVVVDEIEISPAQPTISKPPSLWSFPRLNAIIFDMYLEDEVHMDALFTVKNETSTGIIEFVIFVCWDLTALYPPCMIFIFIHQGHGIQPFGLERIELPLQPGQVSSNHSLSSCLLPG